MKHLLLVFIGGGFGSACRFLLSKWIQQQHQHPFPIGTFTVNFTGSLLIGFLFGISAKYSNWNQQYMLLLVTGFCGGFTTFSSFAYEKIELLKNQQFIWFAAYLILSITIGLLAVWLGIWLSKQLPNSL
ncbi:MAG: fluoride efflux transporter CrcB [Flavobacteriaceae bacterium]|nr:fluoride efflux transporter CrcB [Flavobacteriaceae bacterium]